MLADLSKRTKQFAIEIVGLYQRLPQTAEARVIGHQLLRSGTAVGANYRAVCRARSDADFVAKLGVVLEEADESVFWLELLADTGIVCRDKLTHLVSEGNELTAIFAASRITAQKKRS